MGMTPQHAPNFRVSIEHRKEICRVVEADGIEPCAAHGDRRVMKYDERMLRRSITQRGLESLQLAVIEPAADLSLLLGVEHDESPSADIVVATDAEGRDIEYRSHGLRRVVISGDAEHGNTRIEHFA